MSTETITFMYDVYTLPTAQHRAGLAGLLILCQLLVNQDVPLPVIDSHEPGKYCITWTRESLSAVLNYYYEARWEAAQKKSKSSENVTTSRRPKPAMPFFGDMPEVWRKLWLDALLSVIKHPLSLGPYQKRANGQAIEDWQPLVKKVGQTEDLNGSLFIGAMAANAEQVPFKGKTEEKFLLQFWPMVMGVYQPEIMDNKGQSKYQGYLIVIPDVIDMEMFAFGFQEFIQQLRSDAVGYRPKDSIISLPQEGGLAYLSGIASTQARHSGVYRASVAGVEVYHLQKLGKNVHLLARERLEVKEQVVTAYQEIRQSIRNPIMKRQCILNLLAGKPWYAGFDRVFATHPQELFLPNSKDEKARLLAKQFARDVSQKWSKIKQLEQLKRSYS
jgi:CRISPR-associated protein Cmx8